MQTPDSSQNPNRNQQRHFLSFSKGAVVAASCRCAMQVLAAHADNLSGDQSSACSAYAAALQ
jgi:hypothetical protein